MRHTRIAQFCLLFVFISTAIQASSQTSYVGGAPRPASDPQATLLAARAFAAMTHGASISDVTLAASVTQTAGSETSEGTAKLEALGSNASRVDLVSVGEISEVRTANRAVPEGTWKDASGKVHRASTSNCWTDASWFFPALSFLSQTNNSSLVFAYVGAEQLEDGESVDHIRVYRVSSGDLSNQRAVQRLSTTDFYLDATTHLPASVVFNIHPDDNDQVNIRTEIRYSDYRPVNGVQVPFQIQKLINGTVSLHFLVTNASIDSGVPTSEFTLQ
jgi:hypothetical protein